MQHNQFKQLMVMIFIFLTLPSEAEIQDQIEGIAENFPGRLGICARHLSTGEEIRYLSQEDFPTASSIKTAIMVEFFLQQSEGKVFLDDACGITEEEKVGGSGSLQSATGSVETTYREIIEKMITISDNTATNEAIDAIGGLWDGIHAMNERMKTLGLKHTKLLNKMMWFKTKTKSPDSLRNGVGVTTPEDMVLLYEKIYRNELPDQSPCEQMLEILGRQKYNSIIPGQLPMEEMEGLRVVHKTGSVSDAVIDAGIVYTPRGDYAIALFADGTDEQQWQRMLRGKEEMSVPGTREDWPGVSASVKVLAKISRMIFDYYYEQ